MRNGPAIRAIVRVGGMAIVAILLLSLVPGFVPETDAFGWEASTQTHLPIHRPYANGYPSSAWINKTLSTAEVDDHYELSLAADVHTLSIGGSSLTSPADLSVKVVAAGNSRHSYHYHASVPPFQDAQLSVTYMGEILKNGQPLGDDDGVWIDAMGYDQLPIHYFGAWYDKIFVCSNGYVILGSSEYYQSQPTTISPYPLPFPSDDGVNVIVAPLWRDLIYGSIYWGWTSENGFAIVWDNVRDLMPYTKTPTTLYYRHTFAAVFYPWHPLDEPRPVEFYYTEVHPEPNLDTSIGIEDQSGTVGAIIDHTQLTSGKRVGFSPDLDTAMRVIDGMKLTAMKGSSATTIEVVGIDQVDQNGNIIGTLNTGGVNLKLADTADGKYMTIDGKEAALAGTNLALSGLGLGITCLFPPAGAVGAIALFCGAAGFGLNADQFLNSLSEQPITVEDDATGTDYYAHVDADVLDERIPSWGTDYNWYTWDAAMFPVLKFHIPDASVDQEMFIKVEMTVRNLYYPYGTDVITTDWLTITYNGNQWLQGYSDTGVEFLGRTIPDGHYNKLGLNYGLQGNDFMYEMDSSYRPASEYDYDMMGWSRLTNDFGLDYLTRPDGTIRVEGQFSISDTFSSSDSRRAINVYAMKSGDMTSPAGKQAVSFVNVGNNVLTDRIVTVEGLEPSERVKIGIGRYIWGPTDYHQSVTWGNNIQVFDGNQMRLGVSVPTTHGYTDDPYCNSVDPVLATFTYNYLKTVHAYAYSGYMLDHWVFDGVTVNPGESKTIEGTTVTATAASGGKDGYINFRMNHDHDLEAHFVSAYTLTITSGTGGTTNPAPGTYYFASGTSVTVTAIPNTGYEFDHWVKNGVTYTTNPLVFTIYSNTNLAAYFDALVVPTITVTSPNGGELWLVKSTYTITWTSTDIGPDEYVSFRVYTDGYEYYGAQTLNDGELSWTVPTVSYSENYRVKVYLVSNPDVYDTSDSPFTIATRKITVLTPNGGETWQIGSTYEISWTSSYIAPTDNVEISIIRYEGVSSYAYVFESSTPNDGQYTWTVPDTTALPPRDDWKIAIEWVDWPIVVRDESDANISIIDAPPQVTLTITCSDGIYWTMPDVGVHYYDVGTRVYCAAVPDTGYKFKYWLVDGTTKIRENSFYITMDTPHTIYAYATAGGGGGGGGPPSGPKLVETDVLLSVLVCIHEPQIETPFVVVTDPVNAISCDEVATYREVVPSDS